METTKPFNQSLASHLTQFILSFLENNIFMSIVRGSRWQSNSFCPTKNRERKISSFKRDSRKNCQSIKLCQLLKFSSLRYGNVESWMLLFKAELRFDRHLIVCHGVEIIFYCFSCCKLYELTCNFITLDKWAMVCARMFSFGVGCLGV